MGSVLAQVRFWDVTQGQQVSRLTGHTDYVRAGAVSPLDSNVWATGGTVALSGVPGQTTFAHNLKRSDTCLIGVRSASALLQAVTIICARSGTCEARRRR